MARAPMLKLPRSYYKRRSTPKTLKYPKKDYESFIGPGTYGRDTVRRAFWRQFSADLVTVMRAYHINETITVWQDLKSQGQLDKDVAILVDGSPNRPMKNVKLGGVIDILAQASLETLIEAAMFAWATLIGHASSQPHKPGYARKKNNSYSYEGSFEMFISDRKHVASLGDLGTQADAGKITSADWISIQNYTPYAAKLERYRYPIGSFVYTFKKLRRKYGGQLAIRFDYVESTDSTMKGSKGASIPIAVPVIRIGQPGAFPSRFPPMKKYIRDANRRGRA